MALAKLESLNKLKAVITQNIVVLYEEALDANIVEASLDYITKAEVLIIGGTSLSVYPEAGLIAFFNPKL